MRVFDESQGLSDSFWGASAGRGPPFWDNNERGAAFWSPFLGPFLKASEICRSDFQKGFCVTKTLTSKSKAPISN